MDPNKRDFSKLSIVIPVFNEIATLEKIVAAVSAVDIGLDKEIILVDDASTDGTIDILKAEKLSKLTEKGLTCGLDEYFLTRFG